MDKYMCVGNSTLVHHFAVLNIWLPIILPHPPTPSPLATIITATKKYRIKVLDKAFAYNVNRCLNKPLNLLPKFLFILSFIPQTRRVRMYDIHIYVCSNFFFIYLLQIRHHTFMHVRYIPHISRLKLSKYSR